MILLLQLLHQGLSLRSKAEYFYREDYPLIISHRGASGYIPEHSLPAYEMAIYMGTDFVEPDIIPSKEGTLFIHHDSYLSGTTNVADLPQYADKKVTKTITTVTGPETMTDWFSTDFTDEELKGLKLRQRFADRPQLYNDIYHMITLEDAIQFVIKKNVERKQNNQRLVGVYVEPKHPAYYYSLGYSVLDTLLELLQKYGIDQVSNASQVCPVILQCFDYNALLYLKKKTDLPLVYLYEHGMQYLNITAVGQQVHGIGPDINFIWSSLQDRSPPSKFLDYAHQSELSVHPWVLRDDQFDGAIPYDVYKDVDTQKWDGVFTEFTAVAYDYFTLLAKE